MVKRLHLSNTSKMRTEYLAFWTLIFVFILNSVLWPWYANPPFIFVSSATLHMQTPLQLQNASFQEETINQIQSYYSLGFYKINGKSSNYTNCSILNVTWARIASTSLGCSFMRYCVLNRYVVYGHHMLCRAVKQCHHFFHASAIKQMLLRKEVLSSRLRISYSSVRCLR